DGAFVQYVPIEEEESILIPRREELVREPGTLVELQRDAARIADLATKADLRGRALRRSRHLRHGYRCGRDEQGRKQPQRQSKNSFHNHRIAAGTALFITPNDLHYIFLQTFRVGELQPA